MRPVSIAVQSPSRAVGHPLAACHVAGRLSKPEPNFYPVTCRDPSIKAQQGSDMGRLHVIGTLELRVFGRDHRPAHFHALHPDGDAAWAALTRATLVAEWDRLNPDLSI